MSFLFKSKKDKDLARDYDLVFSSPHGKRVLEHLIITNYVNTPFFEEEPPSKETVLYLEGRRASILDLIAWINSGRKHGSAGVLSDAPVGFMIEKEIIAKDMEE